MPTLNRRKADRPFDASRPPPASAPRNDSSADDWLAHCEARLGQVEPSLSIAERQQLARSMLEFERTGAMTPEAAVDFVVNRMSTTERGLLERRVGRR